MTPKRERYVEKNIDPLPFFNLLAEKPVVVDRDVMAAYGFTPQTNSWPTKVSTIVSRARILLAEKGIVLPRAKYRRGWKLTATDRTKLKEILK